MVSTSACNGLVGLCYTSVMIKGEEENKNRTLTRLSWIAIIVSAISLALSSFVYYSDYSRFSERELLWNASQSLNERSAENRRAIARILACQADPDSCSEIDWSRPYHTMRDVSEDFRFLE